MNSVNYYLKTKPLKLFLSAAIPGSISMLVSSLYQIFESIFVGKFLGTTAFAALGMAMPLVIINFALADLIGVGSSVPISILLGRQEEEKANNYFTCATLMIIVTGLISGILIYFLSPFFMEIMTANAKYENPLDKLNLINLAVRYLRIYAVFSPLITMMFAVDNFLRICGKTKTSMVLNISMSLGTIGLELLFIVVFKMGIIGASLGTCIGMGVIVIIGYSIFATGKLQLKFIKPRYTKNLINQVYKNGLPAFLTNVSGRIFSIIMNFFLISMGGENAVVIYGVLMTIGGIVEMILYGVLDALQPTIGYNYGATKYDRVKIIEKYCVITSAIMSIFCTGLFILLSDILPYPFLEDLSLLDQTSYALKLFSLAYLFKWVSQVIQSFLSALEKPMAAMIISLSSAFIIPLILIGVLYPLNLNGLWLNYPITSLLVGILAIIIILKMKNKLFNNQIDKMLE